MALKGIERVRDGSSEIMALPYIPECERDNITDPFVVWIKPKDAAASNRTLSRYAATRKDRKGYSDLSQRKLNAADIEEWTDLVKRIENFEFSNQFPDLKAQGVISEITDFETIKKVLLDIDTSLVIEIFDAAADASILDAGLKKDWRSSRTSTTGNQKTNTSPEITTATSVNVEGHTKKGPVT